MDEKKAVTMEQLLESARQSEALAMQVAQAAQAEMEKRPTSTEVNEAMDRLFTSVSDGKSLIASAITDKGVSTAADASFQTMRGNILAIESGGSMPEGVYLINVSASTAEGGTVSGGGVASEGMTLTVSANVADGYNFEGWQENGEVVSTDNTYTFTVTGNRTFVAGFAAGFAEFVPRLPDGYTELQYIESTGTQYVNTGLKPTATTKVEMDFEFSDYSGSPRMFGSNSSRKSGSNTYYYYYQAFENNGGFYGGVRGDSLTISVSLIAENIQGRVSLVFDAANKSASINGVPKTIEVSGSMTSTYTQNIYLLCINWNGTASYYSKAKLYLAKIYSGNTLARDFVPCTNPSGDVGLYDLVTGSFYRNSGTGAFVAGPAV